ncbi:hypothetical protein AAV32_16670 [Kerstersia gyiorum]|uniref:Uncharacterized protein n=1 Tax=Kerstersia gyiorum TaxID=206506 RepID=A0A171KNA3_9BURK|nr:hypothetical protein AAV32_16670 [Kerstersia gyiorum]
MAGGLVFRGRLGTGLPVPGPAWPDKSPCAAARFSHRLREGLWPSRRSPSLLIQRQVGLPLVYLNRL